MSLLSDTHRLTRHLVPRYLCTIAQVSVTEEFSEEVSEEVSEEERADGFLCKMERVARRMAGRGEAERGLAMDNGQLVLGSGKFCRVFATPVTRTVADSLGIGERAADIRKASAVFNSVGEFLIETPSGEVLFNFSRAHSESRGDEGKGWWWPPKNVERGPSVPRGDGHGESSEWYVPVG